MLNQVFLGPAKVRFCREITKQKASRQPKIVRTFFDCRYRFHKISYFCILVSEKKVYLGPQ